MKKLLFLFFLCLLFCLVGCRSNSPNATSSDLSETSKDSYEDSSESEYIDSSKNDIDPSIPEVSKIEETSSEETVSEEFVERIDKHTIISQTEGKTIATIFTAEMIQEINERRKNGEVFALTDEEVKYIIQNTMHLFETYSIIRINDIDGNTNAYRGSSFFHSDEYFASFGAKNPATIDSFDYKKDLLEAILKYVEVLHSNIYDGRDDFSKFVLNTSRTFTEAEEKELLGALNSIYELEGSSASSKTILSKYQFSGFYFDIKEEELIFIPLISAADPSTKVSLITNEMLPAKISPKKYDYNGQVIVIELYNNHTNSLVVRLRYDEKNNPEVIKKANELFYASIPNLSGAGNIFQRTQYKAVVYFNGFSFNYADTCISYAPDGDLNIFTFNDPYDLLYSLQNSKPLTEYLNQLLSDYLED